MVKLSVNLNKVALLRNARTIGLPSVTHAAQLCLAAGADGITVHPRPDQRHIRPSDVHDLAALLQSAPWRERGVEFNIEGNPFPDFMALVKAVKPHQCTLVPDSPEQATSDHGWDISADGERLKPLIAELQAEGIRVSLFMDADAEAIRRVPAVGADRVELYTEPYAATWRDEAVWRRFCDAARAALDSGLGVNAGHDLNLENLPQMATLPGLQEVSIGHALIADALEFGLPLTVAKYLAALGRSAAASG